jgi:hypothetical protein
MKRVSMTLLLPTPCHSNSEKDHGERFTRVATNRTTMFWDVVQPLCSRTGVTRPRFHSRQQPIGQLLCKLLPYQLIGFVSTLTA